jgi:hypothetical protein
MAADALRDWLPGVLHEVEPWMSKSDISAGARWSTDIGKQLETTDFGIICVTPENAGEPWINFEAGSLARRLADARVIPYLIGMTTPAELPAGPLSQFQSKVAMSETADVVAAINAQLSRPLNELALRKQFDLWWPELERALEAIPADPPTKVVRPDMNDMLQEILSISRDAARRDRRDGTATGIGPGSVWPSVATTAAAFAEADARLQGVDILSYQVSGTSWVLEIESSKGLQSIEISIPELGKNDPVYLRDFLVRTLVEIAEHQAQDV